VDLSLSIIFFSSSPLLQFSKEIIFKNPVAITDMYDILLITYLEIVKEFASSLQS
jgi:hypothetical protein